MKLPKLKEIVSTLKGLRIARVNEKSNDINNNNNSNNNYNDDDDDDDDDNENLARPESEKWK